jgi:hypothetical protein
MTCSTPYTPAFNLTPLVQLEHCFWIKHLAKRGECPFANIREYINNHFHNMDIVRSGSFKYTRNGALRFITVFGFPSSHSTVCLKLILAFDENTVSLNQLLSRAI